MRVVLAPDCFGGTLTAVEAAEALAAGWRTGAPGSALRLVPLSDGGPGFVDVLAAARPDAQLLTATVADPLARPVPATLLLDGRTAYIESAQAAGLHLLAADERDPRRTTTYGVGQLLGAALDAGADRVVVGLGGSGTNDGGAGALAALGVQPYAADGSRLAPGGSALRDATRLEGRPDGRLAGVDLVVASDVDNPLLGLHGASAVYGPQKGADADTVQVLDAALSRWADLLESHLGVVVRDLPGAGAAGGLGAALLAVGARRTPGIGLVLATTGLTAAVADADLVVTGEGSFDWSSLRGKTVAGVAALAQEHGVPCVVLAGQVSVGRREAAAAGIDAAYAVSDAAGSVEAALARPAERLAELAARVAREWSRG